MADVSLTQEELKLVLKEALTETLEENRELFGQVLSEVLEDILYTRILKEGDKSLAQIRSTMLPAIEGRA